MTQHRQRGRLNIVRNEEIAAVEPGRRLGHHHEADGGARTGAERKRGPAAGAANDLYHITEERRLNFYASHLRSRLGQHLRGKGCEPGGIKIVGVKALVVLLKDADFLLGLRVGDLVLEQEAVKLGFRERISAFKFDRVLRGKNGEELRERMRGAVNGDLA